MEKEACDRHSPREKLGDVCRGSPRDRSHSCGRRLEKELGAWEWAFGNALEWTDTMERKMVRCLRSYLFWSKRRSGVWVPPDGHLVWKLAGICRGNETGIESV